jgi:hypothetical protein
VGSSPLILTVGNSVSEAHLKAHVSSAGTVSAQDTLNGNNWVKDVRSFGTYYIIDFNPGVFSSSPACHMSPVTTSLLFTDIFSEDNAGVAVRFVDTGGSQVQVGFDISCDGY